MLAAKRKILQTLSINGEGYGYAIASDLQLDTSTVYQHLRELEKSGYVLGSRVGKRQMYQLTEKGKRLLELLQA